MTEHNEWIDIERKVPDQVGPFSKGGNFKQVSLMTGKGKKKRSVKLTIPRAMFKQEIKRWFNTALFDTAALGTPAGTPLRTNTFGTIASGGGAINRLGDAIRVHEVVYRLLLVPDNTFTWTVSNLAWIIDNEPAVGLPAWNVCFNTIGAGSVQCYDVAIPAYDTRFRFQYKERMTIPCADRAAYWNGAAAITSVLPIVATVRIPMKGRRVLYDATNAVYSGCELVFMGWSSGAASTLTMSVEVFFSDA